MLSCLSIRNRLYVSWPSECANFEQREGVVTGVRSREKMSYLIIIIVRHHCTSRLRQPRREVPCRSSLLSIEASNASRKPSRCWRNPRICTRLPRGPTISCFAIRTMSPLAPPESELRPELLQPPEPAPSLLRLHHLLYALSFHCCSMQKSQRLECNRRFLSRCLRRAGLRALLLSWWLPDNVKHTIELVAPDNAYCVRR